MVFTGGKVKSNMSMNNIGAGAAIGVGVRVAIGAVINQKKNNTKEK